MKQKTFKNRNKFRNFLLFSLLMLCGGTLQAQPPLKAGFINSFVLPGQKDTINVIKKSELGACTTAGIVVNILNTTAAPGTQSHGAAILSTDGNKNIIYTPAAGFAGQDSVKYTITCGVNTSTGLVLINVMDKPDMIKDEACAVTPPSMVWGIQIGWRSSIKNVFDYLNPLVGDLDGDGIPEIVCFSHVNPEPGIPVASGPYSDVRTVYVFDGKSKVLKDSITLVHGISYYDATPYGLVRLPDGRGLFIVLSWDRLLRAYQIDNSVASLVSNTPVWTATNVISENPKDIGPNLFFADFNHDGWPEICVMNKIYDAATGRLLKTASGGSNVGASWAHYTHVTGRKLSSAIAADVMGDSNLELILGNEIYSVDIQSRTDTTKNSVTRIAYQAPPAGNPAIPNDGHAQVADFNGDGHLDILITLRDIAASAGGTTSGYVWDVYNGTVSAPFQIPTKMSGKSIPVIADFNKDGQLEIVIMTAVAANTNYTQCYTYNPTSQSFSLLWSIQPNEDSYSNGMSAFDFNQDGIMELLTTDQSQIRILNGSGKSHITGNDTLKVYQMATFSFPETTVMQIPIIADIDADESAEILFCSNNTVNTLKSIDPNSPWAPARALWHQYVYNPVFVNEDLTIPSYPLNPATKFIDKNGHYLQPFNNCMQQSTLLNGEGKMLSYGSDLAFDLSVPIVYSNYNSGAGTVDATFNIENTGDADFSGNLNMSAYVLLSGVFTKVQTYILNIAIPAGTSIPISYTITGLPAGIDPANVIQIRINESDDNFLVPECNYSGNFSKALFGAPDYGLCPGMHTLYFYPQNSGYQYVWYNSDPTKLPKPASIDTGDSHDFTKSATQLVEKFYVEVYDGPSLMDTYPVITYLIPDSLVWTGTTSADWNDYRNWNYPNNPQPAITAYDTVKYQIPGECTNVLIAASAPAYPNLNSFGTDVRAEVVCNKIYFAFGGEVARTDTLNYSEAYVDLTLNTHQYYMIAPSLKSMYTGDYYITQPNPFLDDRMYEPMFFNVPNPQTMKTAVTTWTGRFNNPDILLGAGQGMAIWYNKTDQGYTYHNPVTTHFPKTDTQYRYYSEETQAPTLWGSYMDRTDSHRFIYEPLATNGLVPLSLGNQTVTASGTPVLIGNPFMSHLNLDPFLTANNTEIYAGYKLASGVASVDGKMNNFVSYQRVSETWFTTDPNLSGAVVNLTSAPTIAPMQSFIVIAKKANPQIKAPVATMTTTPGNVLRSAAKNEIKVLSIIAQKEDEIDKALLIGAGNSVFNAEEDSYKFFPNNNDKALLVYTRSSDGYALDINSFGNYNDVITLGIKTSQVGQITLKFSGVESFADDATLYLNDTKESRTINLSLQEEYAFTKTADEDLYLENRFFLSWVPNAPTDLKIIEQDGIVIQSSGRNIEIISKNGSPLNNIKIDDTQGRSLISKAHYGASSYHFEAPAAGVYLVKVQSQVKKVVVR